MQGISNFMGLLIVVVAVLGACIGAGIIFTGITQKSVPRVSDLVIHGGSASINGDDTLIIKLVVVPLGDNSITRVYVSKVFKNGDLLEYYAVYYGFVPPVLKPGKSYDIVFILRNVEDIKPGDQITLVIGYLFKTGEVGYSTITLEASS